jgi:GNAT superfamily N-acetyltransferase
MTAVIVRPRSLDVPVASGDRAVEPIRETDRAALLELFASCSAETIQYRFFGPVRQFPRRYLADVLACTPEIHDAVVARHCDGARLIGMASLGALSEYGPGVAELGVLVTDAWQRQGLGMAMVELLLQRARARGVGHVAASVLPGRDGVFRVLDNRLPSHTARRSRESTSKIYDLI